MMTNKNLNNIIKRLNASTLQKGYILTPISLDVDLLEAWLPIPKIKDKYMHYTEPLRFYCVKFEGQYTSIVMDAVGDLHWFTTKQYRNQGILKKALRNVILPFIFIDRDEQSISIDRGYLGKADFEASEKLALGLDFQPIGMNRSGAQLYELKSSDFHQNWQFECYAPGLPVAHLEELQLQMQFYFRMIKMVRTEIYSKYGAVSIIDKLDKIDMLKRSTLDKFEDLKFEASKAITNT